MCLIIYRKNPSVIVPEEIIDQTALENRDGFGITFLDTLQTYRTMDYKLAERYLKEERPYVAHYRYATRGKVGKDMCHPYRFNKGWLYSNGTVDGLGGPSVCDTQVVADFLNVTPKRHWKQLLAMTPTRFAVVEKRGTVSLHGNWIEKDGILYSKDVTIRKVTYYNGGTHYKGSSYKSSTSTNDWQNKSATKGVDEDYWEHEVMSRELKTTEKGQRQLDEWLRERNGDALSADDKELLAELEEADALANLEEEADDFAEFCAELEEAGFSYEASYGTAVADAYGDVYDAFSGDALDEKVVAGWSARVYNFILGIEDPFDDGSYDDDEEEVVVKPDLSGWEDNFNIAVYGTLKAGKGNHALLWSTWKWNENSKGYQQDFEDDWTHPTTFVGNGTTVENLRMEGGLVPYVYPGESQQGGHLTVEVYSVPSTAIRKQVDQLEGHPNFYTRRLTDIVLEDKSIVTAWMYYIEGSEPKPNTKFITKF
jgi:gamma-glutamylcyclotransferase (GGCT)/AIG2-like uncharacterized protein YtfP/predicted glutamine amidotransferase